MFWSQSFGYISKFLIKDIDFHPDISLQNLNHMFTTTDELFSIVPTNDLVIGATTLVSVSSTTSYEVKKVSYDIASTYTSDVYYNEKEYSISILESSTKTFSFNLTCSLSGQTFMTYMLGK